MHSVLYLVKVHCHSIYPNTGGQSERTVAHLSAASIVAVELWLNCRNVRYTDIVFPLSFSGEVFSHIRNKRKARRDNL